MSGIEDAVRDWRWQLGRQLRQAQLLSQPELPGCESWTDSSPLSRAQPAVSREWHRSHAAALEARIKILDRWLEGSHMETEMWQLVDEGYTLTWLILDGRYLVTATRDGHAFCGIGDTREEAWELLQRIKKDKES